MEPLLEVKNLKTAFYTESGVARAVDDVSFTVPRGRTLGIVGESGCGKSVTSLSIMRLIQEPQGKIESGQILFHRDGKAENLLALSPSKMREIRGNKISMVFQEPMTSLNPVFSVGSQLVEPFILHQKLTRKDARARALEMLKLVGIPSPEKRIDDYPHQLSGGMRQRVMIAMALACKPSLLIADEPTTALDVTIQAQILDLMRRLRESLGMSMILITHDLGVIAENADEVLVMYAGKVVEQGTVEEIFSNPQHPYTQGLMNSIPRLDSAKLHKRLETIPGIVPSLLDLPTGCRFQTRCTKVFEKCRQAEPELLVKQRGHKSACHL